MSNKPGKSDERRVPKAVPKPNDGKPTTGTGAVAATTATAATAALNTTVKTATKTGADGAASTDPLPSTLSTVPSLRELKALRSRDSLEMQRKSYDKSHEPHEAPPLKFNLKESMHRQRSNAVKGSHFPLLFKLSFINFRFIPI